MHLSALEDLHYTNTKHSYLYGAAVSQPKYKYIRQAHYKSLTAEGSSRVVINKKCVTFMVIKAKQKMFFILIIVIAFGSLRMLITV